MQQAPGECAAAQAGRAADTHLAVRLGLGLRVGGGRRPAAPAPAASLLHGLLLLPQLIAAAAPAASAPRLPTLRPLPSPLLLLLLLFPQPPQLLLQLPPPPGLQLPPPLLVPPLPLTDAVHFVAVTEGAWRGKGQ